MATEMMAPTMMVVMMSLLLSLELSLLTSIIVDSYDANAMRQFCAPVIYSARSNGADQSQFLASLLERKLTDKWL